MQSLKTLCNFVSSSPASKNVSIKKDSFPSIKKESFPVSNRTDFLGKNHFLTKKFEGLRAYTDIKFSRSEGFQKTPFKAFKDMQGIQSLFDVIKDSGSSVKKEEFSKDKGLKDLPSMVVPGTSFHTQNLVAGFAIIATLKLGGGDYFELLHEAIQFALEGMEKSQGIEAVANLISSGETQEIRSVLLQEINDGIHAIDMKESVETDDMSSQSSRAIKIAVGSIIVVAAITAAALRGMG